MICDNLFVVMLHDLTPLVLRELCSRDPFLFLVECTIATVLIEDSLFIYEDPLSDQSKEK